MSMNQAPKLPPKVSDSDDPKSTSRAAFVALRRGGVSCNLQPEAPSWDG